MIEGHSMWSEKKNKKAEKGTLLENPDEQTTATPDAFKEIISRKREEIAERKKEIEEIESRLERTIGQDVFKQGLDDGNIDPELSDIEIAERLSEIATLQKEYLAELKEYEEKEVKLPFDLAEDDQKAA